MLVQIIDGSVARYPYPESDLRADWPNTSFPSDLALADLAGHNAAVVEPRPSPAVTHLENAVEAAPLFVNGVWVQQWRVEPASAAEIAARTQEQWRVVRYERTARLAACDWTQLPDCPLSNVKQTEWANYRQALRDLTTQTNPFAIVWPVEPQ